MFILDLVYLEPKMAADFLYTVFGAKETRAAMLALLLVG